MATQLFPIITTPDLERSLGFYRDLLGGTVSYEFPGPEGTPGYVGIELGTSHLGIGYDPGLEDVPGRRMSLWIYVEDCDATIGRLRDGGVEIVAEPADQPWGERVARVRDPDGNEVIVGQRAAQG
jgi:lactoylglutathione lyase